MFQTLKIWQHLGHQTIKNVAEVNLPTSFLGRPVISEANCESSCSACIDNCPTQAISQTDVLALDLGKCVFCSECVRICPSQKITFTNDYKTASNSRENLIIKEGKNKSITLDPNWVRKEIVKQFGKSLKLRQVSAAGDNSAEWELNACGNVNFDMGRYGIEFVASPRHADGLVITGPISENMYRALEICYDATPAPKIIILVGVDAISGGIFADSPALNRTFLEKYPIDLYVPGNPPHPLTFINGVLDLIAARR